MQKYLDEVSDYYLLIALLHELKLLNISFYVHAIKIKICSFFEAFNFGLRFI